MRLIFAVFALPFWVFLAAAGGLFYLGELSHRDTLAQNQEMANALANPPPDTVRFADFSRQDDIGLADEVSVQAVINPDYNYELTKKRKGPDTTRFMYVLFDPADAEDSKVARGALVLSAAEKDKFINDYYMANAEIGFGGDSVVSVVTLNGQAEKSPDLSALVNDAFEEQNLTKSGDFIYIEPFLEGRTVGLTPTVSADEMRNIIRGVGLAVALIGLAKFALRRRKKAAPTTLPETNQIGSPLETPASLASNPTNPAPEAKTPRQMKLPIKLVAVLALLGVAIYSGQFVYVALVGIVALQILAVKKTRTLITDGLARVTGKAANQDTSEEKIMANVQEAAREIATPEDAGIDRPQAEATPANAHKRGFSLSLPRLRSKGAETPDALFEVDGEHQDVKNEEKPKRGISLGLSALRRKPAEASDTEFETIPAEIMPSTATEAEKKRGLSLSLPSLRRKNTGDAETAKVAVTKTKTPRKKEAFQSAELFAPDEAEDSQGLAEKMQLLMARFGPTERTPKAFAGRPDPFDRLAAEVQRASAR